MYWQNVVHKNPNDPKLDKSDVEYVTNYYRTDGSVGLIEGMVYVIDVGRVDWWYRPYEIPEDYQVRFERYLIENPDHKCVYTYNSSYLGQWSADGTDMIYNKGDIYRMCETGDFDLTEECAKFLKETNENLYVQILKTKYADTDEDFTDDFMPNLVVFCDLIKYFEKETVYVSFDNVTDDIIDAINGNKTIKLVKVFDCPENHNLNERIKTEVQESQIEYSDSDN